MVAEAVLRDAQGRLDRAYPEFHFELVGHRRAPRPRREIPVRVLGDSGREVAFFFVPLSPNAGTGEVVRRVESTFDRFLGMVPRELIAETRSEGRG